MVARLVVVDMEEDFELLVKLPEDNKGEVQDQLCTLGFQILLQKYIKYSWKKTPTFIEKGNAQFY